ncbi:hypothetical protein APR04_006025 [Promicromonospora umidemergens]|uniref:Transposase n=1 Tax=Promicromonospora umidemergens TaxID=629679 RepID=A0ABP8YGS7_9MICO|nr:hypothetical protein [Promicromonospora umidemergens]MCP2287077.1 hypothetical protein [Promicromonospora umidemergens]
MTTTTIPIEVPAPASPVAPGPDDASAESADEGPRAGRPARRSFTAEYKRAIVAEYDAAPVGQKGAVLRRERLYDSHVQEWRAHIAAGTLGASRRGPRPGTPARTAEIAQLRKQVQTLEKTVADRDARLAQTQGALDVLGKGVACAT